MRMPRLARLPGPGRSTVLAAALAAALAADAPAAHAAPAAAPPAAAQCTRVEIAPPVHVSAGKSTVIRPASPIRRILLGNAEGSRAVAPRPAAPASAAAPGAAAVGEEPQLRPGVADIDVLLLGPTEVYVLGKALGTTNVVLLEQSGRCTAVDVIVSMDTGALQALLAQLMPQEKEVRVSVAYDSIVLAGTVSDSAALAHVLEITNAYVRGAAVGGGGSSGSNVAGINPRIVNMLAVGAPQQVMLEVKVAEVSKSLMDQFGIDFSRAYASADGSMIRFLSGIFGGSNGAMGQLSGTGGAGTPLSSVGTVIGGSIPAAIGVAGNVTQGLSTVNGQVVPNYTTGYGTVPARNVTNLSINAQKTDGLVKILAEPTVMAISGQKGNFLAGGKIFIPVAVDNGSNGRTITLEEKEFGVSVNFLPTVLGGGRVNLEVATEVSELNREGVGLTVPGTSGLAVLPAFTSRRAKTTVQLADGQSFAIGGLIKNNFTTNLRAFPVLGELPVIGALFRSTSFQNDKSELLFVITPRLVKPLPAGFALPTDNVAPPSRAQLHLMGRMEGTPPSAEAAEAAEAPAPTPAPAGAGGFQVK
ncbi:type II and III secretion system protein family protein [Azohydromonas australica]|uniref:type II and III secretion system protein family protein n=1 Tax=Azohydromonas australica TaxID=364039 RepID=UPI001EE4926F|nr:pilus assembly protein N-terminal domain-containing protein [Azohydromonas australica]